MTQSGQGRISRLSFLRFEYDVHRTQITKVRLGNVVDFGRVNTRHRAGQYKLPLLYSGAMFAQSVDEPFDCI
jgi:hypothetical protein